jgi:DNA-binding NarL/FixJ family response regulator
LEKQTRKYHINIVVVDDHPLLREGVVSKLRKGQGIKIAGEASNGVELFNIMQQEEVDVVLLDLQMPEMNGPQSLQLLKAQYPTVKVLVFSMFNEKRMIREMLRLGAGGYVTKDITVEDLIDAIYNVHYRGFHAQHEEMRQLIHSVQAEIKGTRGLPEKAEPLKDRDLIILSMICEGLISEEIAPRLHISKQTVDLSRTKLIAHFGARNAMHMVTEAIRLGYYTPFK